MLLSGCSLHPESGAFSYSYAEVFTAAKAAVAKHPDVEVDNATGVITTGWAPARLSQKVQGFFQEESYVERVRYEIRIPMGSDPVSVDVIARLERRPPSGPRSIRWQRVPSEGKYEKYLLGRISDVLEGGKK